MITIFLAFLILTLFCGIVKKDPILFRIAAMFTLVHFFNIFYYPTTWIDLCGEAVLCAMMGKITLLYSGRSWAKHINIIMTSSIILILIEYTDYWVTDSYLELWYQQWIYVITGLEIAVLLLASNGYLQYYTDDLRDDFRVNGNNHGPHFFNKISIRQD